MVMTRWRAVLVALGTVLSLVGVGVVTGVAADAAPARRQLVVTDEFGPGDTFNASGLRSATTPPYGNPPATHALAQRITIPAGKKRVELQDLDLALRSSTLSRATVKITADNPAGNPYTQPGLGVPDESNTVYSSSVTVAAEAAVYHVGPAAKANPTFLEAGKQYWVMLLAPDPASTVAWFSAYQEHPQVIAERDSSLHDGAWAAVEASGGFALRVTAG